MLLVRALLVALGAAPCELPLRACAWVRAENDGVGSGFVIDTEKRLLVTCRHVVADRRKFDVFFPWVRGGAVVTDRGAYLRNRAELRARQLLVTGTVLKTSDELDLALLELEALPPGTLAVQLAVREPHPGDLVRVVGHRIDLDTVWNVTTGPLRTRGTLADGYFWRGQKLAVGAEVLIGQLPIEEGDSGGPVFNWQGELVGVTCAMRRQCPLAAVAIAAPAIRRFISADGPILKGEPNRIAEALAGATVWVKPTATDLHIAGVLIDNDLVLTCARGLIADERVGVALPMREHGRLVSDRGAYRSPLALYHKGAWCSGVVIARDPGRDLAVIRLDAKCAGLKPVPLAAALPKPGDTLHTMSHPGGLEFAFVYAGGSVRQRGRVALDIGPDAPRVAVLVCQLPGHSGSPGGPVLNATGELVGVLSAREGAQMISYAATTDEIRAFLDVSLHDRPPRTLAGLQARAKALVRLYFSAAARGLAARADDHRRAGRLDDAKRDCDSAVRLDPTCTAARLCRARMLPPEAALAELDTAAERGLFHRDALVLRAELAIAAKDWRKARGDLERVLSVFPADAEAQRKLVSAYLGLGDDTKAAAAVCDTLRADPQQLPLLAADLLTQADTLRQKFPGAPGIPADWLMKALAAAEQGTSDLKTKQSLAEIRKAAFATKNAAERLHVLRAGIDKLR